MTDWYKGDTYMAYEIRLPKGYSVYVNVAEHQSGKVSVRQAVSKIVGSFDPKSMKLKLGSLNTSFYNKLNKMLVKEVEVS